jgi:hypothetical protein
MVFYSLPRLERCGKEGCGVSSCPARRAYEAHASHVLSGTATGTHAERGPWCSRKRGETRAHGVLARIHRRVRAGALLGVRTCPSRVSAPPQQARMLRKARWECPHAALIPLAALCADDIWTWRQPVRCECRSRCSCMQSYEFFCVRQQLEIECCDALLVLYTLL